MAGLMSLGLFAGIGLALMAGFPVAFTLAGVALIFAGLGILTGAFDPAKPICGRGAVLGLRRFAAEPRCSRLEGSRPDRWRLYARHAQVVPRSSEILEVAQARAGNRG